MTLVKLARWTCLLLLLWGAGCQARTEETPSPAGADGLLRIGIPNGRVPLAGMLTGGQPSQDQLRKAADLGIRTVINMRPLDEKGSIRDEGAIVTELGMSYVHMPIEGLKDLTRENAERFAEVVEGAEKPVMIHCASGNRIGAMLALKTFHVDGASVDEAMKMGREGGLTRLAPETRKLLDNR